MTSRIEVEVPAGAAGSRADRFMADASGLSRAYVQRLIAEGRLTAAGRVVRARDPVAAGARMELDVPEARDDVVEPEAIPLDVVYEDRDVIVIDKPAGLVTHPAPGHEHGTVVNALLAMDEGRGELATLAGVRRPGIVHRLDRDTSGLLIVARNDAAQAALQAQLKARRVKKTYQALVAGAVTAQAGRIEKPIGRDPRDRMRMAVVADGKPAVTGYRVRERLGTWTLLEVDLVTGRTHQVRVHLASIGHPVAGDPVYARGAARRGPDGLERLFLHAWRLEFVTPASGELVRLEAPLPIDLATVVEGLRATHVAGGALTVRAVEGRAGAQLVIISGPSGVGKDAILAAMQRRMPPHPRHYVITCTTRPRRNGEVDGVSYLFVSQEDFARLRDNDNLLEASEVHGNWYGTPRDQVQSALASGRDAILKIDVQGARKVRAAVPDALLIFVVPPSLEVLRERLLGRNTEASADLERRFEDAAHELARQDEYDHVVINETDLIERTAQAIEDIIAAEHERYPNRRILV